MKINLNNKIRYKIEVNCPEFISGWIFSKSTSLKIINLEINKKIISFSKIDQLREDVNTAYKINKSLLTGFKINFPNKYSGSINNISLSVYDENQRLREQNSRLLKWQNKALALTAENSTLRQMLNFVPEKGTETAAARVIGDTRGVFAQSVLINAGVAAAVERGDAVVGDRGLVGRVAEAGHKSARVLLITDFNSRIPVVSEKNRVRGILFGDNSSAPRLAFLPTDNGLELGDRIVTSGHGHVFPAGFPVGTISSIEEGDIRVVPFVNFDRLEYVRIITHFPGEINGRIVPSTVRTLQVK